MVRWLGSPDEHGTVTADRIHLAKSQSVNTSQNLGYHITDFESEEK